MKSILITGGSGFLGIHLANKLKKKFKIILAGRNNKQNFYAKNKTTCEVLPMDVSNIESVRDAINYAKPNIIIHAAATKFVDLSEKYPLECIDINITGSTNIARVAIDKKIESVIGISTDKASPPIRNIYGMSKSLMEKIFVSLGDTHKTKFACVRYGNVAWSTGSVLPVWSEMFKKNKTIYTTGPYMRRFFFTVNEAVELVTTCLERINSLSGKILSREMKSAQMIDILNIWIKLYGGKFIISKERPGERVDEFLIGETELPFTEKKIIRNINHYIIDFKKKSRKPLKEIISSHNCEKLNFLEIKKIIEFKKFL
jgi:UDP-N-acetylglucosamine 4,6-dehydratase/5-epimerase